MTPAAIARTVGVARATASAWLRREKSPSAEARERLAAAFPSVPASAWEHEAGAARAASPAHVAGAIANAPSTVAEVEALLSAAREAANAPGLLPGTKVRAIGEIRALLGLKARIESQAAERELGRMRFTLKDPNYQAARARFIGAIVQALAPHRAAHADVEAAIRRLEAEEAAR